MVDYDRMRRVMVDNQLRTNNIIDPRILTVMARIPRELFVPEDRRPLAYIDDSHVFAGIAEDRSLAAPAPFARLIQLADIAAGDHILDVGAASGYSSAVLAALGGTVIGIEREPALVELAKANLESLGIANAEIRQGPHDAPPKGRFDVIVIEGAVDAVPQALLDALAEGSRLVALVRTGMVSVAQLHVRSGEVVTARSAFNASLPPLEVLAREEKFVF